ncbi:MAG: GIY-YIG nuclease family protein [Brevinema sp.]
MEHLLSLKNASWFVYILECQNGSFYTGITKNVEKRFHIHTAGKGAKYTKIHRPKKIVYIEQVSSHSEALKRELFIKKMTKSQKISLCTDYLLSLS